MRISDWSSDVCSSDLAFLCDAHGRDHATVAELALDADGRFLAQRVETVANMGAYLSTFAPCVPTYLYATLLAGQYTTRSEEHTSELPSLMRISYAVFCLKQTKKTTTDSTSHVLYSN